ncbi:unnamed protein product [Caenorhabditis bovis]|uniref:Transmembrane protein n=1 Tax=Caenorhabditis bovis TaxID=2654633 RepID=A0A8S1EN56_9PELO|nr:unnamed protein product [Caenorhabditis bovis]
MLLRHTNVFHSLSIGRTPVVLSALILLVVLLSTSLAEQQTWTVPDDGAALAHEIPVLHTAFVQIGEELHYISNQLHADRVQHLPVLETVKMDDESLKVVSVADAKMPVQLEPSMLDFGENSVGTVQNKVIYLRNTHNEEIGLDAVVVNSIEFQASFYKKLTLAPLETTPINVAFLPREVGKREGQVNFYTSAGIFGYKVVGNCISNPYRIAPFAGLRVPMNSTITKPIVLYNPHHFAISVNEISSSGGNVHVEMPYTIDDIDAEEMPQLWHIRPFQSKHVANMVLVGAMTENSTAFVRMAVKPADPEVNEEIDDIYLTLPFEVTLSRGVYSTSEMLDFGLLRNDERSNPLVFSVFQFKLGSRLEFETLYVEKGDHTGIYMEFASHPPIAVMPPTRTALTTGPVTDLVKVYFDASKLDFGGKPTAMKRYTGSIIAVSRGGNYNLSIPFKAEVFKGDIIPVGNDLALQEDLRPPHQRTIRLENRLPFDIAIWNVSLSSNAQSHFSVRLLNQVIAISSGDIGPAFVLKYNKKVPNDFANGFVYVQTNASTFRLKIDKYNGKMNIELTSVDKDRFDFGYVERNDTRSIRFIVWNHNNAQMKLHKLAVPSRDAYRLYEVGQLKVGNLFNDVSNDERIEYVQATDVEVAPNSGIVFDLELKVPFDGAVCNDHILFETEFESKLFPVTYHVSTGSLQSIPDEFSFGLTSPARLVYRTLQVFNSFTEDMTVIRLSTLNRDPRIFFELFDQYQPPVLRSGRLTNLGRVMFTPRVPCAEEYCYLGFPISVNDTSEPDGVSDGQWFVHGLQLPANLAEVDAYLYKKQRAKFEALVASGKHRVNTTIVLDTDKAKNIKIKTSAEMVWPRLLTRNSITFPNTALGNFTIMNLTLANPSNLPVAIQVIPLVIYPDAENLVELFRPYLQSPLTEHVEMNETLMFSLRDTELFTLKPDSPIPALREELERIIPVNGIPRFTLSMLLKPHMKVRLRVGFLPTDYQLRSSLLLIRNNLTVIEPVVVYGRGAKIGVRVENAEARSSKPLLFEIRHDHLSDCNNPKRKKCTFKDRNATESEEKELLALPALEAEYALKEKVLIEVFNGTLRSLMHKLHSTLTVRRPFNVYNTGDVEFTVTNMSINSVSCENRGFRILNCYPFRLLPNESYALDIAYTPDFLATTNEADLQLYMHMNGSAWLFPLAATVPADMLAKCHQALPRPPFENMMYYSCVTALIFCLVCVLACAYLEGDRTIACAIRQQFATPRHVFDLNNLTKKEPEATTLDDNKPEWKERAPSTLRAANDASVISRITVQIANWVVLAVYYVLKPLIIRRNNAAEVPTPTKPGKPKKKKKNPVTLIKQTTEDESDASVRTDVTNNNKKTSTTTTTALTPKPPPAKVSKSPKAHVQSKNRKKSVEQTKLATVSRDSSRHSGKSRQQNKKKAEPEPEPEDARMKEKENKTKEVKKVSRQRPPRTPSPPSEPEPPPEPEPQPQLHAQPQPQLVPNNIPAAPINYTDPSVIAAFQEFMLNGGTPMYAPNPAVWNSAAAAAAMPFLNVGMPWGFGTTMTLDQLYLIQQQVMQQPEYPPPPVTPTPVAATSSENVSDAEEAPDWADEEVNASDAEADFSTMAAATRFMDDEDDDRRKRSSSVASSVTSTLSRRLDHATQQVQSRRLTIGSEKKDRVVDPFTSFDQPPAQQGLYGIDSGLSSLWSSSTSSDVPTVSSEPVNSIWGGVNSTTATNSMFSDFGNHEFGNTMFTGREFNLWSDSKFDPTTAWANLGKPDNPEEPEKDKK